MIDIVYPISYSELFDTLFPNIAQQYRPTASSRFTSGANARACSSSSAYIPTLSSIPISRVTYSGNKTIVWFVDGTKTTVTCSSKDTYDRQTAIAYALVKRIFGKVGRTDPKTGTFYSNEIDGNGLGIKLEKIANAGFDQDAEKKNLAAKKAQAKAAHEARQKAEHDAAWKRRVKERAEQLRLEREANALLDQEDSLRKTGGKKILNESANADKFFNNDSNAAVSCSPGSILYTYKKPDKPFSQFTQAEKRDYWRYQNAKRRASK